MKDSLDLKSPLSLCAGVKILTNGEQSILLNLMTSKWLRLPKHITVLIEASANKQPESEILKYSETNKIPQENIINLLNYLVHEGYLQSSLSFNIEGVDVVNYSNTGLTDFSINEIYNFQILSIDIKGNNKNRLQDILTVSKKGGIKHVRLHIGEVDDSNSIYEIINLASDLFDQVGIIISLKLLSQLKLSKINNKNTVNFNVNGDLLIEQYPLKKDIQEIILSLNIAKHLDGFKYVFCFSYNVLNNKNFFDTFIAISELQIPISLSTCFPIPGKKYSVQNTNQNINNYKKILQYLTNVDALAPIELDYRFYRKLKLSCGAGKSGIYISENGNVYPCIELVDHRFLLGNILKESFDKIQDRSSEILDRQNVTDEVQCKECNIAYFCGGGCPARRLKNNKDKMIDPICDYISKSIGQNPWIFNEDAARKDNLKNMLKAIG